MDSALHEPLSQDLSKAMIAKARRDCDLVERFLRYCGFPPPDPLAIAPVGFILELAAGLQMISWELQGIPIHRQIGLPSGGEYIRAIFKAYSEPGPKSLTGIPWLVLMLFMERVAWHGRSHLTAEIVVDNLDEEAALDALAEFLWATREKK